MHKNVNVSTVYVYLNTVLDKVFSVKATPSNPSLTRVKNTFVAKTTSLTFCVDSN